MSPSYFLPLNKTIMANLNTYYSRFRNRNTFIYSIIILLFFSSSSAFAQLKYEGFIDAKYKTVQLDDGSFKYVKYDKIKQEVSLVDLNNELWRTVKLPLPKNHHLDEVKSVSLHTFNSDDLVELVYSCVEYDSQLSEDPDDDIVLVNFTLNIINENGDLILKVQDSNEMEIIQTNNQSKLLIYKHIGRGFNEKDETLIYSLPTRK